jgi:Flp pilus assembly protein TadG
VAAVEFAIAGVTIMVLLLAIFDIAILFLDQRGLDYSVQRAARWAAVNSATASTATVLAQFQNEANAFFNASSCAAYASAGAVPAASTCSVVVAFSNGANVGSVVSLQAKYAWGPTNSITGFVAMNLTSSTTVVIVN